MNGLTANCITCTGSVTILSNLGMRFNKKRKHFELHFENFKFNTTERTLQEDSYFIHPGDTFWLHAIVFNVVYTYITMVNYYDNVKNKKS